MAREGGTPRSVGSIMLLVLLAGVVLGFFRFLWDTRGSDWVERILTMHAIGLGLLVPIGTLLMLSWFATGKGDQNERAHLILAIGCVAWVFVFGSLVFWFITIVVIALIP